MNSRYSLFFRSYFNPLLCFIITVCSIRLYEYLKIASRFFLTDTYQYELSGLIYDVWACFIFSCLFLLPYFLLYLIHKRLASFAWHFVQVLLIILYLALLIVFSERTHPYDHEFFTRNGADSWITTKQMLASGFRLYIPFVVYLFIYFAGYFLLFRKIRLKKYGLLCMLCLSLLALLWIPFAMPSKKRYTNPGAYNLVCNKFSYWVNDCYHFFANKKSSATRHLNNKELESEIVFYQQNHPFDYTSTEYPLLHQNNGRDVLGSFFNLNKTPPNIVILVIEGLSRDFSGDKAYATSFTPFLDSLSEKSLTWDNFLSTAPGTFAAHPAISGSLPYGKRGFSVLSVMPDHLSLIKILRLNGYQTNFMIGFNPDFDNMGGYIRLQGMDLVLSQFGAKYKQMGVGSEGWSMGYPDDALYSRSFEVLDSIKRMPYLNIYHTGTTHMPYLFEQKPVYDKLFDDKMKTIAVAANIKRTLKACKKVLVTYMFADDCLKQFFKEYTKRPEFGNTLFFITGDHHIGSFPSTGNIDDYHVPLIVYSPMLKAAKKFYSVNSHNNLAPTITALLLNNYPMPYNPAEVNWMAGVMDTCSAFRNIQSMPFMAWSREINDYIYKEYMLSENRLYRLTPDLLEEDYKNDSLKDHITRLLENFKLINSYTCENNKIFPASQIFSEAKEKAILNFSDSTTRDMFIHSDDTDLMTPFAIPKEYKYLYVEVTADISISKPGKEDLPTFQLGLVNIKNNDRDLIYSSNRDIEMMTKNDYHPGQWNHVTTNDMFTLDDYKNYNNMSFCLSLSNPKKSLHLKTRQMKVMIYGIK